MNITTPKPSILSIIKQLENNNINNIDSIDFLYLIIIFLIFILFFTLFSLFNINSELNSYHNLLERMKDIFIHQNNLNKSYEEKIRKLELKTEDLELELSKFYISS